MLLNRRPQVDDKTFIGNGLGVFDFAIHIERLKPEPGMRLIVLMSGLDHLAEHATIVLIVFGEFRS
ncbi:hypothetical protein D3C85_1433100 [compost metagenome]